MEAMTATGAILIVGLTLAGIGYSMGMAAGLMVSTEARSHCGEDD